MTAIGVCQAAVDWIADHPDLPPSVIDDAVRRLARTTATPANAERMVESVLDLTDAPEQERLPGSSMEFILNPATTFVWLQRRSPSKFQLGCGATPEGVES